MTTQENISTPTWKDFEKAILDILRAGIEYKCPKDKGFMSWYKKQLDELRASEDPELHIYEKATNLFPNEDTYKEITEPHKTYYKKWLKVRKTIQKYYELCYNLAKESFHTNESIEEELDEWVNS